ncbi:MAG: glycosyltransferase family 4 protein [Candidatus Cloacimonadales bacterium]|nr:glycosyltransferase family 4 protein [Candidatus Cloacimonadales bacterium]
MRKLLFISSYDSSFVKSDIEILEKHFQVEIPKFKKTKRNSFDFLKMSFRIFWGVMHSDLVFCWFADFAAFLAVKAARFFHKKAFVVVGGYEVSNLPGYGGITDKRRRDRLKYTLQNSARVISVSDFSKAEIDALNLGIIPEKISIGVKLQKSDFQKTNLIITSGRATKELFRLKGLDIFAKATTDITDHQFKIIGHYDEEIKQQLLTINPQIEFTGQLPHDRFLEMLKIAKIYCQFSQRESFGLAVLEAMNFGCTPVVSKAGAMPEIVGETGFICEYGDVENTKIAIKKAIKLNRLPEMKRRVVDYFSLQQREEKLLKLIGLE